MNRSIKFNKKETESKWIIPHTVLERWTMCFSSYENCELKVKLWKLIYRNLKKNDSNQFKLDICDSMSAVRTHAAFEKNFVSILDKHAPKKTKILRGNQ